VDTVGGQAVGILPDPQFVSARIRLAPGDTLVVYTDRYDDHDALLDFASAHSPATATSVVAAIQTLLDSFGSGLEDDVAVMALGVPPATAVTGSES
jgi:sigma-B regulation protein RsbU (phosphoserine phosphatase)